jgi:hypothetical protein
MMDRINSTLRMLTNRKFLEEILRDESRLIQRIFTKSFLSRGSIGAPFPLVLDRSKRQFFLVVF